jgi:hypothetical protein
MIRARWLGAWAPDCLKVAVKPLIAITMGEPAGGA